MPTNELDRIDLRMLAHLQTHARSTNLELAEVVSLSPAQCLRRHRRLEEEGFLQRYDNRLSAPRMGLTVVAFIHVAMEKGHIREMPRFRDLIAGSKIDFAEVCRRAPENWYIEAEEARDVINSVRAARDLPASDARAHAAQPERRVRKALLWGGNLSVLCSLVGTPHLPAIKGGILFVEDVNEHPYRVERQLTQLLNAGVIGAQKAVLLGSFSPFKLVPGHDRGFKFQTVVDWLRAQTKTPVYTGLPYGHVPTKVVLPVGRKVDLLVQGREALLYWG